MRKISLPIVLSLLASLFVGIAPSQAANPTLTPSGDKVAIAGQYLMSYSGGYLWVGKYYDEATKSIRIIKTSDNTSITSGALSSGVAGISGNGTSAWVALLNGNVVKVAANGTVSTEISTGCTGPYPWNNFIHSSGDYVVLSCFGSNRVVSISALTNEVLSSTSLNYPFAAFVRGPYTYVSLNSDNKILRLLTTDLTQVTRSTNNVGFYFNSRAKFNVDNSYIYILSANTNVAPRATRYRFSDGQVVNATLPGTSDSYTGIASDNTNTYVSFANTKMLYSIDFAAAGTPTVANALSAPLTSVDGELAYSGTNLWALVNSQVVEYGGVALSKSLQAILTLQSSPASATTKTSPITLSTTGGTGAGAVTYSIDPASTASGCTLNSPTSPTSISASSGGTCLVIATKAGGATYEDEISLPQTFTFDIQKVTSVSPSSATYNGGTSVTITGTQFAAGATVTIGGKACTSVVVVSATTITCVTPAGTVGAKDVVVTNADTSTTTLASGFTYIVINPTATAVTPTTVDAAGGTTITITGTLFQAGATVDVAGTPCTNVVVVSATQITCAIPALAVGWKAITVTNPDGGKVDRASSLSYYIPVLTVTNSQPTKGNVTGGTTLTLTGTLFKTDTTVTVGGNPCTSVTRISDTQLTCVTPAGTTGFAPIVVSNPGGGTVTRNNAFQYYVPVFSVVSVAPATGTNSGGTRITVNGDLYLSGATVTVGDKPCTSVVFVSTFQLTCITPAGTAGAVTVEVTNPGGAKANKASAFTYAVVNPTVGAVSPSTVLTTGGKTITIRGTAFAPGTTVTIGDAPCTAVVVVSETELNCVVPAAAAGLKSIVITNTGGGSGTRANAINYVVPNPPGTPVAPTLTAAAGKVTVNMSIPSTGGAPTSYLATLSPGGKTCTVTAPSRTCEVKGLDSKIAYTATYVAINADGQSAASPASSAVTPLPGPPMTPAAPTVVPGNGKVTVKATPATGGDAAATLKVIATPGDAFCVITLPAKSCDITGLTNKTTYSFKVIATNQLGDSEASEEATGIPVDPNADVAPEEGDGNTPPKAITGGGANKFVETNDKTFQLAWDKNAGKLISRATGIYTGYIEARASFTVGDVAYSCTTVFGTLKAMPMKTAAQKTASMKMKTFTGKQFCIDKIKMDAKTLSPKGGMTAANFKKIKSMNKTAAELANEKLALAALKNFTGEVQIQVTRYRAWPTTMVNIGDHNSKGGKIPFLIRNTKVTLG